MSLLMVSSTVVKEDSPKELSSVCVGILKLTDTPASCTRRIAHQAWKMSREFWKVRTSEARRMAKPVSPRMVSIVDVSLVEQKRSWRRGPERARM